MSTPPSASDWIFVFGYETDGDSRTNERHGDDSERSGAVVIRAPSRAAAEAWGLEVARAFHADVLGQPRESADSYASYVVVDEAERRQLLASHPALPVVDIGTMPPLRALGTTD